MSRTLLQAWKEVLGRCGSSQAVTQAEDGTSATFMELEARASAWCRKHAPISTRLAGRVVVFAAPNGIGWLEIFLGLLKVGAIAAPLDAAEPLAAQRRLAHSLRAGAWWSQNRLEELPGAKRYRDSTVRLIKLTSGSTGVPRALAFTDSQLLADARQVTATMGIRLRDLNYALIPLGHSYGLGNLTVPLVALGVPLVCGTASLPHAIAADFARWSPTVFPGVPAIWRALASSDLTLPSLRLAISAGAPLPPEVASAFAIRFGRRIHSFYGSSETGGIAYDRSGAGALQGRVGRPMRGVAVRNLARERLEVSSAAVLTHGNRRRAGRYGAWLMADQVRLGPLGDVTLLGRRSAMVKIAGRRVSLVEVLERLKQLPEVRDAWVGVSSGSEPVLGAAVATERSAPDLRTALLVDTAAWKIPKRIITLAELPVNSRGKIDTQRLQTAVF